MESKTATCASGTVMKAGGMTTTKNDNKPVGGDTVVVINPELEQAKNRIAELEERLSHVALYDGDLQLQHYIDGPPVKQGKEALYNQACSGDNVTITSWFDIWLNHVAENIKLFDVKKHDCYSEYAKNAYKPCIIAGSGPSLRKNVKELVDNKKDICLVSCLHNFGFFEDHGIKADYYVNLDAGPITIDEMPQGGKKDAEYYWERTKNHTLVTAVTGNPELHNKWRGRILFYNVLAPTPEYVKALEKMLEMKTVFSVGGNSLGACLYFAKAILGSGPIAFVGADFCFGYDKKFHSWDSPYDQQYSGLIPCTDIYGNRRYTWPSYFNFKCWFEYIACGGKGNQPGMYYNCTEGGILGAYPEGNIRQITQMSLKEFLFVYNVHKMLPELYEKPGYNLLF